MGNKNSTTLCVEEEGTIYKVSKIYVGSDGSFSVDVPYCQYEKGLLFKFPTRYKFEETIHTKDFTQAYFSRNRPKLSIHASGAVHFSGPGIRSGFDDKEMPKGLGLFSNKLSNPVRSGPTFSISCYGLKNGYEILTNPDKKNTFIFQKDTFIQNSPFTAEQLNTCLLDGWVIPINELNNESHFMQSEEGEIILAMIPLVSKTKRFPMRVIRLPKVNSIICIMPNYSFTSFPLKHPYGFILSSPTEQSKEDPAVWFAMQAMYPDMLKDILSTLDYQVPAPDKNTDDGGGK